MRAETQKAREHLQAAGSSAADSLRENASSAADAARARVKGASDWARSRFTDLQGRVEQRPQSSALWALGIGVVAGLLVGTLFRGRD
ncbi:MAG: hypothetical protein ACREU3_12615 [Steroidobacteraceae bacterium]